MARSHRTLWITIALTALVACGALILSPCYTEQSRIEWLRSVQEATTQAAKNNRLIVADIYTDWCSWCRKMDVYTWGDPSVIAQRENYVFLKLNAETDPDGIALQKKFGIHSYPMVLLLDSQGREFDRLEGYLPAQSFLHKLQSTLEDPEALGNLRERESREPQNLGLRFRLAKELFTRNDFGDAETRFDQIQRQDPENKSQVADLSLLYLALCHASQSRVDAAVQTLEHLRKTFPGSQVLPKADFLSGEILLQNGRRRAGRERILDFIKRYPTHPLAGEAHTLLSEN